MTQMDPGQRAALLAHFDQSIEAIVQVAIADAGRFDHLDPAAAVMAFYPEVLGARWTVETLAISYAQLAVRLRRIERGDHHSTPDTGSSPAGGEG